MYIQKTDEDCYLINLSKEEMKSYSVTYKPTGVYNEKDKEAFMKILKNYKKPFHFKNITLDILPGTDESCVAIIKEKTEEDLSYFVFESDNLDNFIDCAKVLKKRNKKVYSALYKDEKHYRLITKNTTEDTFLILSEFSYTLPFTKAEKSYTESYMECLIKSNALEILSGK